MESIASVSPVFFLLAIVLICSVLFIIALSMNWSLTPPPKQREFASALADWAGQNGLHYSPQRVQVLNGIYNNRWFTIGTANEEQALRIRMSIKNPHRTSLQIFGNWLEDSGVIAFPDRFRVYSTPSGLSETLFDNDTRLRHSLLGFPGLRARMELFLDPKDPNHLHYSLLTDLPGADTLETIMACLHRFCDAFEEQFAQEGNATR